MPVESRQLLFAATLEECGHPFEVWVETESDGSYSIHFYAPCDECERLARVIAREVYPTSAIIKVL